MFSHFSKSALFSAAILLGLAPALRGDGVHAPPSTVTASPETDAIYLVGLIPRLGDNSQGRAIEAALRAIHVRPENSDHWVRLGDQLRQLSRDTQDITLYREVERSYLRASQIDPTNPQAFVGLAWAAGASHRFDESIKWAGQALKLYPDEPAAYGLLGDAAVEMGRYDDASKAYQKMLDLRPDMGSYSRAGHLVYLEGNGPRGMALMQQAIQAGGNNPEHTAWCVAELANMMCREGTAPVALKLVEQSLQHAPNNVALLAADARARMSTGDDAGAIAALEKATALAPQHATLAALHDLYLATNRPDDARRIAGQIEAWHRKLEEHYVYGGEGELARFYADNNENIPLAVTLAEREYSHHAHAIAADTLAWAYYRAGRFEDAAKLLPVVLKHRVSDPAMLYHAGLIEEARGDRGAASRHLYAALSREPRFNPVHALRCQQALERLGSVPAPTAQPVAARPTR